MVVLGFLLDQAAARAAGCPAPSPAAARAVARAAAFRRGRQNLQIAQLAQLTDRLPLPRIELPYLFTADVGPAELGVIVAALRAGIAGLP